jgi:hypothetical protein
MRPGNCMPLCAASSPEIGEDAIVSFVTLKPPVRRDQQCHCKIALTLSESYAPSLPVDRSWATAAGVFTQTRRR